MSMHNPSHPGALLAEDALPALGISGNDLAAHLSFPAHILLDVLQARAPLNADLAVRLELAGIGMAHNWLAMQMAFDLWQAQHRTLPVVERLVP
ncbi:HigA family addiction module antitoxin [Pseudomonas sp. TWI628]|uniref:HigA family addiction module antitoxin n=1 Tax=unclassified Pseudomonas TaxID=196821 RepID=UPI00320A035D